MPSDSAAHVCAAIYLRIFLDREMDGLAIDRQCEDCENLAKFRRWWPGLVLWAGCLEGCWLLLVLLCPLARVGVGWEPAQRCGGVPHRSGATRRR